MINNHQSTNITLNLPLVAVVVSVLVGTSGTADKEAAAVGEVTTGVLSLFTSQGFGGEGIIKGEREKIKLFWEK